jgi:hypothetical protein
MRLRSTRECAGAYRRWASAQARWRASRHPAHIFAPPRQCAIRNLPALHRQAIARSGVTVTQLQCFRYHKNVLNYPTQQNVGGILVFNTKCTGECRPHFAACGTPDRDIVRGCHSLFAILSLSFVLRAFFRTNVVLEMAKEPIALRMAQLLTVSCQRVRYNMSRAPCSFYNPPASRWSGTAVQVERCRLQLPGTRRRRIGHRAAGLRPA